MWLFAGPYHYTSTSTILGKHHFGNMAVPPLATELVLTILEMVHEEDVRTTTKKRSIVQCATVCKAWTPMCQALIFRNVTLPSLRTLKGFTSAVERQTPKAKWLRELVRSLEITVSDEEDGGIITQ